MPAGEIVRRNGRPCAEGPWEVPAGGFQEVALDLHMGERMRGRLIEEDGMDFDWEIVDEPSSVLMREGEEYDDLLDGEGVTADWIEFKKDFEEDIFLILSAPRRQRDRLVRVQLRRA